MLVSFVCCVLPLTASTEVPVVPSTGVWDHACFDFLSSVVYPNTERSEVKLLVSTVLWIYVL